MGKPRRKRISKQALSDALAAKRELSRRHFGASNSSSGAWVMRRRVRDVLQNADRHLHSIGVGRKVVDGEPTDTISVRFYVTQKLPKHLLVGSPYLLPSRIDGIETDIIEAPPAYLAAPLALCSTLRLRQQRPAQGGISGANEAITAGTLAALCVSRRGDEAGQLFVLGNNHTLADLGAAPPGSAILQPAPRDGGAALDRIAGLHRCAPIVETTIAGNLVDAAIARLDGGIVMDRTVCSMGAVNGIESAAPDMQVQKHGRTTGFTTGIIDDHSVDILLPLRREDPSRLTQFVDQIRIRPRPGVFVFAQPGDSGALVLTKSGNRAIGLLFACPDNGSFAYASPMAAILDQLDIDLL